jgi:cytochrome P450
MRVTREHGPLVRVPLGPRSFTLVSHPDDLRLVLQEHAKQYERGRAVDVIRPMLGNGLPMSDGDVWRRKRRTMQPAFNRGHLNGLVDTMVSVTERYVARFHDGQALNTSDLMMRLTRDIIVETMFSDELGSDTAELDAALATLERYVARYAFVPVHVPVWLPTPDNYGFRNAIGSLDRLVLRLVDSRRKTGAKHNDLLDALLAARDEQGEPMPARELRDELVNIFFAGHETTANTLTWTTFLLSKHPDVFERVREEADRVLGDRRPTAEDVAKLEYTTAVLREALRLYPPGWIFGRIAKEDDNLRGHAIHKDDMLAICPLVTHRMPEYWPNPERFDPERFVGDRTGGNRGFTYLPFGAGPHMCIGNYFALTEAALAVAMIVRRAKLVVEHPEGVQMRSTVTLQVAGGLPVRVQMRSRS